MYGLCAFNASDVCAASEMYAVFVASQMRILDKQIRHGMSRGEHCQFSAATRMGCCSIRHHRRDNREPFWAVILNPDLPLIIVKRTVRVCYSSAVCFNLTVNISMVVEVLLTMQDR